MPENLVSSVGSLSDLQMSVFLMCPHMACPLHECGERALQCLFPLPVWIPVLSDCGSTLISSFNLNYLPEAPVSKYSHIRGWGFNP